jgi:hypothetical protein
MPSAATANAVAKQASTTATETFQPAAKHKANALPANKQKPEIVLQHKVALENKNAMLENGVNASQPAQFANPIQLQHVFQ